MELKSFTKLDNGKLVLDGLVWDTNAEKAIEVVNNETKGKVHSLNVDGVYYYPCAIDTRKKK